VSDLEPATAATGMSDDELADQVTTAIDARMAQRIADARRRREARNADRARRAAARDAGLAQRHASKLARDRATAPDDQDHRGDD
jgi:hypothetical protein